MIAAAVRRLEWPENFSSSPGQGWLFFNSGLVGLELGATATWKAAGGWCDAGVRRLGKSPFLEGSGGGGPRTL
jgi:hypothetical protein